jgi:hypothetical protein
MAYRLPLSIGLIAALSVLGVLPGHAQTPAPAATAPSTTPATTAGTPAKASPGATPAGSSDAAKKDVSLPGTERKDTIVLHPKDGDTISVRLPIQGQVFIDSLIPWAVTGGKQSKQMEVFFGVRGMGVQHTGNDGGAKASFTVHLIDGRTLTFNIRAVRAKYKVGYEIIT